LLGAVTVTEKQPPTCAPMYEPNLCGYVEDDISESIEEMSHVSKVCYFGIIIIYIIGLVLHPKSQK
jgi:hypothetical protein